MANDPTTTNSAASSVDSVIADAITGAETAIETSTDAALDAALPVFALPVLKELSDEIIKIVVEKIGSQVSVNLQTFGTFVVIDTQVGSEETGISMALQNIILAEKSGDPAAIQKAIQAYANAQSSLVHDDGSAPVQS